MLPRTAKLVLIHLEPLWGKNWLVSLLLFSKVVDLDPLVSSTYFRLKCCKVSKISQKRCVRNSRCNSSSVVKTKFRSESGRKRYPIVSYVIGDGSYRKRFDLYKWKSTSLRFGYDGLSPWKTTPFAKSLAASALTKGARA